MNNLNAILDRTRQDKAKADEELFPLVYNELRALAARTMSAERPGHTLQPTALVHEAWLRLGGDEQPDWQNRAHFFFAAAEAMRRILIERARRKSAQRRGSGAVHLSLDAAETTPVTDPEEELLAVHEALDRLAAVDQVAANLVRLRYFAGLSMPEAAAALDLTVRTAARRWSYARAWLRQKIRPEVG